MIVAARVARRRGTEFGLLSPQTCMSESPPYQWKRAVERILAHVTAKHGMFLAKYGDVPARFLVLTRVRGQTPWRGLRKRIAALVPHAWHIAHGACVRPPLGCCRNDAPIGCKAECALRSRRATGRLIVRSTSAGARALRRTTTCRM